MKCLMWLLVIAVSMVVSPLLYMWLTSVLTDFGYLPHALTYGQAFHLTVVLAVIAFIVGITKGITNALD